VREATLSTDRINIAARHAHRSLGFELIGDYALSIFAPDASEALDALRRSIG
jgi:hypothetical protein